MVDEKKLLSHPILEKNGVTWPSRVENSMSPVLTFFLYMSHVGFFPRKSSFGADASMHAVFGALNARVHFRKKIKSPISAQKAFFGTQFILYAQTHVIFFHRSVPYDQGNATRPFNPCRLTPLSFTDVKNEILGQNMCVFMSIVGYLLNKLFRENRVGLSPTSCHWA